MALRAWRRSGAGQVLLAVLAPAAAPAGGGVAGGALGGVDPVARETLVRGLAADPGAHRAELARRLAARAWDERADAVEALRRSAEAGGRLPEAWEREALAAAARDPHPSVRAEALRAAAALGLAPAVGFGASGAGGGAPGADVDLPALDAGVLDGNVDAVDVDARALAADVDPRVREALALALAPVAASAGGASLLLGLAGDRDPAVARAAAATLLTAGADAAEAQRELLLGRARAGRDEELVQGLHALARTEIAPELAAALRSELPAAAAGDGARAARLAALAEALALGAGEPGDPERLVRGWTADGAARDPRHAALLVRAGRGGSAALADALLAAVAAEGPEDGGDALLRRHDLLDAALAAIGAAGAVRRAIELELAPETLAFVVGEAGRRVAAWEPEVAASLLDAARRPPAVRRAAVDALAASHWRGEGGAASLVRALDDPDPAVAHAAFRALAGARDPAAHAEALHAAWRALPEDERRARLDELPRTAALAPFRSDLLALARDPGEPARRSAIELLAPFAGDAGVREALAEVLAEARRELERDGASRAAEGVAVAAVRALAAVDRAGAAEALEAALATSVGRSVELGKSAAAALGASRATAERLAAWIGDEVEPRTRIEAAIGLAPLGGELGARAAAALARDLERAAGDLRPRMLEALGRTGAEAARELLAALARDARAAPDDRRRALGALAHLGADGRAVVAEAARAESDGELRRAAVEILAATPPAEARPVLLEVLASLDGPGAGPEDEGRALLRAETLLALERAGGLPDELFGEVLRAPLAAADEALRARFRGASRAVPAFEWRAELELAERLARRGALGRALAATPGWRRLDARLLLALGAQAAAAGEAAAAAALDRAGIVASAGEADPARDAVVRARLRRLDAHAAAGEHELFARAAERLLAERRRGTLSEPLWVEAFGAFDRDRGVDPEARLASAIPRARAWAALGGGDLEKARELARRAARLVGHSRLAREAQAILQDAL